MYYVTLNIYNKLTCIKNSIVNLGTQLADISRSVFTAVEETEAPALEKSFNNIINILCCVAKHSSGKCKINKSKCSTSTNKISSAERFYVYDFPEVTCPSPLPLDQSSSSNIPPPTHPTRPPNSAALYKSNKASWAWLAVGPSPPSTHAAHFWHGLQHVIWLLSNLISWRY